MRLEGILKKVGRKQTVVLLVPREQGDPVTKNLRDAEKHFDPADVTEDGVKAEFEYGEDGNTPLKVTVVGKEPVAPRQSGSTASRGRGQQHGNSDRHSGRQHHPRSDTQGNQGSRSKMIQEPPSVLERPFHNPYTFLPFGDPSGRRREPTLQTAEEAAGETRYTGTLTLQITTQRPLMTLHPTPISGDKDSHRTYAAMTIGNDVIVPATGIRGALRTLMTVITGGTLGYLNLNSYLCQSRDLPMAIQDPSRDPGHPDAEKAKCVLARVETVGSAIKPGRVRTGETHLVYAGSLIKLLGGNERKNGGGSKKLRGDQTHWIGFDEHGEIEPISNTKTDGTPWQVKASETPIGGDVDTRTFDERVDEPGAGKKLRTLCKREGIFLADDSDDAVKTLSPEMWQAYFERHTGDAAKRIKTGDLVWLELSQDEQFIESIQWARWGRRGTKLANLVAEKHAAVLPDHVAAGNRHPDGKVDEVTALFGQVNVDRHDEVTAFAARLRPDNLVFRDGKSKLEKNVVLAPMSRPNPGCVAFYRDNDDPNAISQDDGLRGYKVYRVGAEGDEPWRWDEQPVFDGNRPADGTTHKLNRTVDLLAPGCTGELQIAFRSLSRRELALLIATCHLPWRLGGGKPLGLGLCDVQVTGLRDSLGRVLAVDDWTIAAGRVEGWQAEVTDDFGDRMNAYRATQQPVERLRYPRAAKRTHQGTNAGGHIWFTSFAKPRMAGNNEIKPGVEVTVIQQGSTLEASLKQKGIELGTEALISGQVLPRFDAEEPLSDLLFGYGLDLPQRDLDELKDFRPGSGPRPDNRGPNHNPNRDSRQQTKQDRKQR